MKSHQEVYEVANNVVDYLKELLDKQATIHIKLNTGMNRLGVNNRQNFNFEVIKDILNQLNILVILLE